MGPLLGGSVVGQMGIGGPVFLTHCPHPVLPVLKVVAVKVEAVL